MKSYRGSRKRHDIHEIDLQNLYSHAVMQKISKDHTLALCDTMSMDSSATRE